MFYYILSFLWLWFSALQTCLLASTIQGQMHEAMLQVNGYAGIHGIRYGMISNGLWSWVFRNDGCNNMSLSQAFRYDATTPTVLEVNRH